MSGKRCSTTSPSSTVRRRRSPLTGLALAAALALSAAVARAQDTTDAYIRAQHLEQQNAFRPAANAYREALDKDPGALGALLGLERVYDQLGVRDSMLPVLERALTIDPRNAAIRGIQLRTLAAVGTRAQERAAFDDWRRAVPNDPAPYRAYARLLLSQGETAAADTILRQGAASAGSASGFAYETAMLRASMGLWPLAAQAWRQAVLDRPYFAQAAAFSLMPTPAPQRGAVRAALGAPPAKAGPRAVLAQLELTWGDARAGWTALRDLPADSEAFLAWTEFAQRAEGIEAWLVARDALVAAARGTQADLLARAARDALRGGDARGADSLAALACARADSTEAASGAAPVRVEALSTLGRAADAERVAAAYAPYADADQRVAMTRLVAWAWVRAGDLTRARAALDAAGGGGGDAAGWLALYDGDLATARKRVTPERARTPDELAAAAFLGRTTRDSSRAAGRAFLALARGDSAGAARDLVRAAADCPDAAPLLLALAGRIDAARGDDASAMALWKRVVEEYASAPEAPVSELAWARALRRAHRDAEAITRLEHLILTYPDSALLPQARRELDAARNALPAAS